MNKQMEWPWGSPLSLVADFYMEAFERIALQLAHLQPSFYRRYVNDIFLIWTHGLPELYEFMDFLHHLHSNIQFIMEMESGGCLPFCGNTVLPPLTSVKAEMVCRGLNTIISCVKEISQWI